MPAKKLSSETRPRVSSSAPGTRRYRIQLDYVLVVPADKPISMAMHAGDLAMHDAGDQK